MRRCFYKSTNREVNAISKPQNILRDKNCHILRIAALIFFLLSHSVFCSNSGTAPPEIPRIDFIEMMEVQPQETDHATIWYDDFDGPWKDYSLKKGDTDSLVYFGLSGKSLQCKYIKGKVPGSGGVRVFFGDCPWGVKSRRGESFDEIYFRFYVKHQRGWIPGRSQKMARAMSIVSLYDWRQAMVAHVWCPTMIPPGYLALDPVSCVEEDKVLSRRYNDFEVFKWLRRGIGSKFKIASTEESGCWICIESRVKLNTPGKKDGINQLWIEGRLEAEIKDLDFRGNYTQHGINAVFLGSYCSFGSPADQKRWYDNFVISQNRIGPVVTSPNPTLYKTEYYGPEEQLDWEVEIASDDEGINVIWHSGFIQNKSYVIVNIDNGEFVGVLAGKSGLTNREKYYCRIRQRSSNQIWSEWSRWHQPFIASSL